MRYLDDIVESHANQSNGNNQLEFIDKIRRVEQMLNKQKNSDSSSDVNNYEKLVFAEMFARFQCDFTNSETVDPLKNGWNIDFFKVADFDFLYYKTIEWENAAIKFWVFNKTNNTLIILINPYSILSFIVFKNYKY